MAEARLQALDERADAVGAEPARPVGSCGEGVEILEARETVAIVRRQLARRLRKGARNGGVVRACAR